MKELLMNKKIAGLVLAIFLSAGSAYVGYDLKEAVCEECPKCEVLGPEKE